MAQLSGPLPALPISSAQEVDDASGPTPRKKRRRLNFACNYCRNRKTRCDEQFPSCRACLAAGVPCVTVNRRRPGSQVERREAGQAEAGPSVQVRTASVISDSPHSLEPSSILYQRDDLEEETSLRTVQPHVPRFQGKLPIISQHQARNSMEILIHWLDVAIHRLGRPRSAVAVLAGLSGIPRSVAVRLPAAHHLPGMESCRILVSEYFKTVNLVYPLLQRESTMDFISYVQDYGPERFSERYGLALLVQMYLALILGARSREDTVAPQYLEGIEDYCKTVYGHILSQGDLDTVRATALMALVLKNRGHDTAAYAMITQSLSTAISMGIRDSRTPQTIAPMLAELNTSQRVWWSLYSLEKLSAFELGRASQFLDSYGRSDNIAASTLDDLSQEASAFYVVISLATVLNEIGARCIQAGAREDSSCSPEDIQAAIFEKVQTTGECCMRLSEWAESLPLKHRPTAEIPYNKQYYPFQSFVSMQYHNVLLMLCRNSLLITQEAIWQSSEVIAKGQPWEHFVRTGQAITANAARKILTTLIEGADHKLKSVMPVLFTAFHACFVLYIHIIRHTNSNMVAVDRMIILNAIDQLAISQASTRNADDGFRTAVQKFKNMVNGSSVELYEPNSKDNDGIIPEVTNDAGTFLEQRIPAANAVQISNDVLDVHSANALDAEGITSRQGTWDQNQPDLLNNWPMNDAADTPMLPDQIGWDWEGFLQLFPTPVSPGGG